MKKRRASRAVAAVWRSREKLEERCGANLEEREARRKERIARGDALTPDELKQAIVKAMQLRRDRELEDPWHPDPLRRDARIHVARSFPRRKHTPSKDPSLPRHGLATKREIHEGVEEILDAIVAPERVSPAVDCLADPESQERKLILVYTYGEQFSRANQDDVFGLAPLSVKESSTEPRGLTQREIAEVATLCRRILEVALPLAGASELSSAAMLTWQRTEILVPDALRFITEKLNEVANQDQVEALVAVKFVLEELLLCKMPARNILQSPVMVWETNLHAIPPVLQKLQECVPRVEAIEPTGTETLSPAALKAMISEAVMAARVTEEKPTEHADPSSGAGIDEFAFIKHGKTWQVAFRGKSAPVRGSTGMDWYARLIEKPHPEQPMPSPLLTGAREEYVSQAALDEEGHAKLEREGKRLLAKSEEQREAGNEEEADRLKEEAVTIAKELQRHRGLGGRQRGFGTTSAARGKPSVSKRSAETVRKALERARADMTEAGLQDLVKHLLVSVKRENNGWVYHPSGHSAPTWVVRR